jgi:hypothetical protein
VSHFRIHGESESVDTDAADDRSIVLSSDATGAR